MSDKEEKDGPKLDVNKSPVSARRAKKLLVLSEYLSKQESRNTTKRVSRLLKKAVVDLTEEERETLGKNQDIVKRIHKNQERKLLSEQRTQEKEDTEEELRTKSEELAQAIKASKRTVIYTGAGISTAASIPDYRGPQGVWTLLQRGEELKPQDLSDAEPTITHMCITELLNQGHVTHVVSQNCDGLHIRSGFPRKTLSEVHGNMFVEICYNCKPHREYIRLFDVTENTGVRRHYTGRHCHVCKGELKDTIVHFGEKGRLKSPYRWREAAKAANKCDLILCLGSSLKILKKYGCLWCMDRARYKRPKLIIVNLQWTPKDEAASLKINGRCDDVMVRVMKTLGITPPLYKRELDPIFLQACYMQDSETESFSKKSLVMPECLQQQRSSTDGCPQVCSSDSESSDSSSESSCSDTDESESETDSESESDEEDNKVDLKMNQVNYKNNFRNNGENAMLHEEKMVWMQQKYLEKSRQICNEALQKRISEKTGGPNIGWENISQVRNQVNSINPHYVSVSGITNIPAQGSQNHHSPKLVYQEEHSYSRPKTLSDGKVNSPSQLFKGLTYEERLLQLQVLQSQLKELKDKQREIKQQELQQTQHLKQLCAGAQIQQQNLHTSHPASLNNVKVEHPNTVPGGKIEAASTMDQAMAVVQQEVERLETHRQLYQESQLGQLKQRIETEKVELKQQHSNEHLRLNQQCLIQQQMIEQTGLGPMRLAENVRWFEEQQQVLFARQTFQLQELLTRHQALERDLRLHLDAFNRDTAQKISQLKAALAQSLALSVAVNSNMCPGNAGVMPQTSGTVLSGLKSPNSVNPASGMMGLNVKCGLDVKPVVPVMTSPSQTDHSIDSIINSPPQRRKSESGVTVQSPPAIPGFQELVSTLMMCDVCKSLPAHQRAGMRCPRCEALKEQKHCQTLAGLTNMAKQVATDSPHVPNVQNHHYAYSHSHSALQQTSAHSETVAFTQVKSRTDAYNSCSTSHFNESPSVVPNQTYLQSHLTQAGPTVNNKDKDKSNAGRGHIHSSGVTKLSSSLLKEAMTTSTSNRTSSVSSELELSPVIPYASRNAKKVQDATSVISDSNKKSKSYTAGRTDTQANNTMQTIGTETEVKPVLLIENKAVKNDLDTGANKNNLSVKSDRKASVHSLSKPFRSHSLSEVYDKKEEVECEIRTVRSRSQSEVPSTAEGEVEVKIEEDVSREASPADGLAEDVGSKAQKKRKLARTVSVPGWFGKGLNLKKKKRY